MKLLAKLRKSKTTPVLAPAAPAATLQDPKPLEAKERPHIYRLVDILQAQGSPMTLKELTSAYGQAYGEDIENIQNFRTILGLNLLGSGTLSNGNQLCAGRWECIARAVPQVFDVVSNGQEQRIEAKPNARYILDTYAWPNGFLAPERFTMDEQQILDQIIEAVEQLHEDSADELRCLVQRSKRVEELYVGRSRAGKNRDGSKKVRKTKVSLDMDRFSCFLHSKKPAPLEMNNMFAELRPLKNIDVHGLMFLGGNAVKLDWKDIIGAAVLRDARSMLIRDAWIRKQHQRELLDQLITYIIDSSPEIEAVYVATDVKAMHQQEVTALNGVLQRFARPDRDVQLLSEVFHDRMIVFDNRYLVLIGRGLDIFTREKTNRDTYVCTFKFR